MKYIPNAITISRILVTPLFLVLLLSGKFHLQLWALVIFILASLSDWLDGVLARSFQAGSRLGRFLDPFADKVLVLGTFAVLPIVLPGVVPWWSVIVIASRDFIVTGLRTWHEARGNPLATMPLARTKTLSQLVFLILVLLLLVVSKIPGWFGQTAWSLLQGPVIFWFLMLVVALTAYTGVRYLVFQRKVPLSRVNG